MTLMKTRGGIEIIRVLPACNNVLLIKKENSYILVDSGLENKWSNINKKLNKLGFDNDESLKALILTHAHSDHAGNASKIKEKYRPMVIAHHLAAEHLQTGFHRCKENVYTPVKTDLLVDERYDLSPFGVEGEIIYTPGHTMGCISIILENEIALTGDALPGKTWAREFSPTGVNPELQIASSKKLLDSGCRYYFCAHGKSHERDDLQRLYDEYIESVSK